MRNILDASALIAFLRQEPAADTVEQLLNGGKTAMVSLNLAESVEILMRIDSIPRAKLEEIVVPLISKAVAMIDLDSELSWQAAELRATHYHRRDLPISLADCSLLAAASKDDTIVTSDLPILRLAGRLGVQAQQLPDSSGKTVEV